jgi:hypothetical protein
MGGTGDLFAIRGARIRLEPGRCRASARYSTFAATARANWPQRREHVLVRTPFERAAGWKGAVHTGHGTSHAATRHGRHIASPGSSEPVPCQMWRPHAPAHLTVGRRGIGSPFVVVVGSLSHSPTWERYLATALRVAEPLHQKSVLTNRRAGTATARRRGPAGRAARPSRRQRERDDRPCRERQRCRHGDVLGSLRNRERHQPLILRSPPAPAGKHAKVPDAQVRALSGLPGAVPGATGSAP